jgi:hypothetical protein
MGVVYKAEGERLGRDVALKIQAMIGRIEEAVSTLRQRELAKPWVTARQALREKGDLFLRKSLGELG